MKIIQNEIDESHPWYEFFKDKGGDLVVAGLAERAPVILNAIKTYFILQGIMLP